MRLIGIAVIAATLLPACGAVSVPLPAGGGPPPVDDGAVRADDAVATTEPTRDPAPVAAGLVLRGDGLTDGIDGSDWQCAGGLCLRGRITP